MSGFEDIFSVAGKTALVTGRSRGIGYMIAEGLLRAGARVYLSSREEQACSQAQQVLSPSSIASLQGCTRWPNGAFRVAMSTRGEAGLVAVADAIERLIPVPETVPARSTRLDDAIGGAQK